MNVILGGIFLIVCVLIGYKCSEKYVLREKFYMDFAGFNDKLINEILYTQKTLSQVMGLIDADGEFYKVVKNYVVDKKFQNVGYLSEQENDAVRNYLTVIGKGDKISQTQLLKSEKVNIDEKKSKSEQEKGKYRSLYIKVGFMVGLIIFIALL